MTMLDLILSDPLSNTGPYLLGMTSIRIPSPRLVRHCFLISLDLPSGGTWPFVNLSRPHLKRSLLEASNSKRVIDRATDDLATIQQRPPEAPAQSNLEDRQRPDTSSSSAHACFVFSSSLSSSLILGLFTKTKSNLQQPPPETFSKVLPSCRTHCKPKKLHATVQSGYWIATAETAMMAVADDMPTTALRGSDREDLPLADYILRKTQFLYALVLLTAFISCAAWYSVVNAKKQEDLVQPTVKGPGGKPLPITKKKLSRDGARKIGPGFGRTAKNVFRYLAGIVFLCYVGSASFMFYHAFWYEDPYRWSKEGLPWAGEWSVVHIVGALFFHLYILISLFDWRKGPNIVHFTVWILAFIGEIILFSTTAVAAADCHFFRSVRNKDSEKDGNCVDYWTKIDLVFYFLRILHLLALIGVFSLAWIRKVRSEDKKAEEGRPAESTPLLNGHRRSYDTANGQPANGQVANGREPNGREANGRRSRGRTISNAHRSTGYSRKDESTAFYRPEKLPHKTWWEYLKGYSLFFPYLWPKDSPKLQINVLICFILVLLQRLVNVAVPMQVKRVVNSLEEVIKLVADGERLSMDNFPLKNFVILGLLWILQGQSGLLGSARSILWIPVSQYSYRGLTTAAFNHVHSLSLDFHLSKRTGEVLSALNKGASINQFLEQVTFQVFPMLVDLFPRHFRILHLLRAAIR
ncbi:hypothetical protein CEP52_009107 [Fusarium oligoseptatum]|uniref:ABC transmembrane type-1 domain-containing protein n=1 Tax=Fusarium oligoseptatum TaxID=2604345 RepID=A0A428TEM5_9HYPO|nr:hypothetical protein CEP52_009107 [Fusarium oligoseptatum]